MVKINDILLEAPKIQPGDIRAIEAKIENYKDELRKLEKVQQSYSSLVFAEHPPAVLEKIEALSGKIDAEIQKLEAQLAKKRDPKSGMPAAQMKVFEAIKRHCTAATKLTRHDVSFYSKIESDKKMLYGRTPDANEAAAQKNPSLQTYLESRNFDVNLTNSIALKKTRYSGNYQIFPVDSAKVLQVPNWAYESTLYWDTLQAEVNSQEIIEYLKPRFTKYTNFVEFAQLGKMNTESIYLISGDYYALSSDDYADYSDNLSSKFTNYVYYYS